MPLIMGKVLYSMYSGRFLHTLGGKFSIPAMVLPRENAELHPTTETVVAFGPVGRRVRPEHRIRFA